MDIYLDKDTCLHIASIGENIAKAINRLAAAQEKRNEILLADTSRMDAMTRAVSAMAEGLDAGLTQEDNDGM